MTRLIGDQGQQQQFQVARGKHSRAASTAFPTGAFLEPIAAVAVVTEVRAVVMGVIV